MVQFKIKKGNYLCVRSGDQGTDMTSKELWLLPTAFSVALLHSENYKSCSVVCLQNSNSPTGVKEVLAFHTIGAVWEHALE